MARQLAEATYDKKQKKKEEENLIQSLTVELFHLRCVDYPVQGEVTWQ